MTPRMHRGVGTIKQRLDLIAQRIDVSVTKPQRAMDGREYMLKDLTHFVIGGTPEHGPASETEPIDAIFKYVKNNVEYRQDPAGYDYYMGAGRAVNSRGGDCDDLTILLCSMLDSVGYRTGARVISPDGNQWHIYALVGVDPAFNGTPSRVIPLDAAYGDEPGWEPAGRFRKFEQQCTFFKGKVIGYKVVRSGRSWLNLFG